VAVKHYMRSRARDGVGGWEEICAVVLDGERRGKKTVYAKTI
jgi:hypothetical protein